MKKVRNKMLNNAFTNCTKFSNLKLKIFRVKSKI